MPDRFLGLKSLIGNTPLLEIDCRFRGRRRLVYAKAEHLNLTGSVKDRMAWHILRRAHADGTLRAGAPIAEATSGNTGISFAALGRALGHPVEIFMPDWMSAERINLIRFLGAQVHLLSAAEGGFAGSIQRAEELAGRDESVFLPRQFSNAHNLEAHELATGPEIWSQLGFRGMVPDAFVAGVGTGGTLMGVGRYLRGMVPGVRLFPVEPASSPTLSTGHCVGRHRIPGISDEFVPPMVDLDYLDDIVAVDDGDAILMAQRLARHLGLAVGISSGANFVAALKVLDLLGDGAVVVTVFPDDNKKYLSTDLMREEPVRAGYLAPDVELSGFRSFKRTCDTCCDPEECADVGGRASPGPCSLGSMGGPERVILVDGRDVAVGEAEKLEAHRSGALHRAFSVFVLDHAGRVLLQRRAKSKYHSSGLWSNTCCGHPRPGEDSLAAAARRLREEMGFDCSLQRAGAFVYRAQLGDLVEHEYDHVFVGRFDGSPQPDPADVAEWRWVAVAELQKDLRAKPEHYTVWLAKALGQLRQALHSPTSRRKPA